MAQSLVTFKLALVDEAGNPVPFYMVANDGNIMEHTVYFENGTATYLWVSLNVTTSLLISASLNQVTGLYFVNMLQHKNGQVTDTIIPLEDIVDGTYAPTTQDDDGDGMVDRWVDGDPVVGKFMEFRVAEYDGEDLKYQSCRLC